MKKNKEKPLWLKIYGISVVVLLVLNLVLMAAKVYNEIVFWVVLIVLGGSGWIVVKILNKK